jgi:hypothetical protein
MASGRRAAAGRHRRPGPDQQPGRGHPDALVAAKVPAVLLGSGSVFASAVAEDWLTLAGRTRAAASATFARPHSPASCGWTFAELAAADEHS